MATGRDFVEHVRNQSGLADAISYKKMFGEYAIYLEGKVVAFACDNQLYVKPTPEGRDILRTVSEHPPYPGAKLYFRVDDEIDDRELLRRLLKATANALPPPKPSRRENPSANSECSSHS